MRRLLALGLALVLSASAVAGAAEPGGEAPAAGAVEPAPYSSYQGAYWGLQLHLGGVYRLDAGDGEAPGALIGVSGRVATVASLLDLQLTVLGSTYEVRSAADEAVDVQRLSAGLEGHLHPLFLRHLEGSRLDLWLAGLYLAAGAGVALTALDGAGRERLEVDFGWHLGAGMDYPLTDPHRGWSLWLGLAYRLEFLFVSTGIPGLRDFSEHSLVLTLGYRSNDIFTARVPRPTELDYREPAHPEGHDPP